MLALVVGLGPSVLAAERPATPGTPPLRPMGLLAIGRKLAMLTEMARPLLAKLPAMIDVTPGADVEPQGNPSTVSPKLSY